MTGVTRCLSKGTADEPEAKKKKIKMLENETTMRNTCVVTCVHQHQVLTTRAYTVLAEEDKTDKVNYLPNEYKSIRNIIHKGRTRQVLSLLLQSFP